MSGAPGGVVVLLFFLLVVTAPFTVPFGLGMWTRWLGKRCAIPWWPRSIARVLSWTAAAMLGLGIFGEIMLQATPVFRAPANASYLSPREEWNAAADAIYVGLGLTTVAVSWLVGCTCKWYWAAREPRAPQQPPYR